MTNRIAILDDRQDAAETVLNGLSPHVSTGWEVVLCPLKRRVSDYSDWIVRNDIRVLIVDQLLNEASPTSGQAVQYKGHDVIREVRRRLPDFPIVIATKAVLDSDLQSNFGSADEVVDRAMLNKNAGQYIKRFMRLGLKYLSTYNDELSDLGKLSKKAASGEITRAESKLLQSIQAKLNLVAPEVSVDTYLRDVSKELLAAKKIQKQLKEKMAGLKNSLKSIKATKGKKS